MKKIAIIGTVGIPASYGGFETLVENLTRYNSSGVEYNVFCSSFHYKSPQKKHNGARLIYIPLKANGWQSIAYDIISLAYSIFLKPDVILILGVSGCSFLPFFKLLTRAKFITNIDGLEWRRDKWNSKVKRFLKFSEKIAVQYSDVVITDNEAISEYVFNEYNKDSRVIAYGGDHAWLNTEDVFTTRNYKSDYYLSVCRIEPENNVELILKTFSKLKYKIKFIGNWNGSEFGKKLRLHYSNYPNIEMIDPIYDLQQLFHLRNNCMGYIHGHSAGGTNPSLVEAMHFSKPIFAYDCKFNRYTTENEACYFSNESDLAEKIIMHCELSLGVSGTKMKEIANQKYTWRRIAEMYEDCY
ncbi:TPA: glycosyltransferase family 1 protein [Escherichia coli]|uniref:DUF1972 domain-containing protein n=2 Tax=Escherichia coli TaxID=562 RepID=UPI00069BAE96|nr:DUF1972 domain-containing protein [Escherichia coli]EEV5810924.1 glycosyltransferase family 1 protein [Escherichia coli]EEZ5992897.1 glycosyltransferase family 1 protein [Escherichia coli]EFB5413122.1 glycosyltransferase family 1 protein [Escherichia coli]EFB9492337.1 glycosyltransferase family 1 protein [Escherichia coli]EFC1981010.1 glycosyltransferase family 1 protein [Escherichia coli]